MMVGMFFYIILIGKNIEINISHQSLVLETKQLLNQMVSCFFPEISVDNSIKNRE